MNNDLIARLQRLGDGEHDDLDVAYEALAEIIRLRMEIAAAPTTPAQQDDEVLEVLRRIVDVWGSHWPPGTDPMQDVIRDACALLEKRGAA